MVGHIHVACLLQSGAITHRVKELQEVEVGDVTVVVGGVRVEEVKEKCVWLCGMRRGSLKINTAPT